MAGGGEKSVLVSIDKRLRLGHVTTMPRLPTFGAFSLRCLAGGRCLMMVMAVLAILSTFSLTFGLHLHVEPGHGVDVISKFDVGDQPGLSCGHVGHEPHPPLTEVDPDGCGHCHCPAPVSDLPADGAEFIKTSVILTLSFLAVVQNDNGISYQPDPPPAKG